MIRCCATHHHAGDGCPATVAGIRALFATKQQHACCALPICVRCSLFAVVMVSSMSAASCDIAGMLLSALAQAGVAWTRLLRLDCAVVPDLWHAQHLPDRCTCLHLPSGDTALLST